MKYKVAYLTTRKEREWSISSRSSIGFHLDPFNYSLQDKIFKATAVQQIK